MFLHNPRAIHIFAAYTGARRFSQNVCVHTMQTVGIPPRVVAVAAGPNLHVSRARSLSSLSLSTIPPSAPLSPYRGRVCCLCPAFCSLSLSLYRQSFTFIRPRYPRSSSLYATSYPESAISLMRETRCTYRSWKLIGVAATRLFCLRLCIRIG